MTATHHQYDDEPRNGTTPEPEAAASTSSAGDRGGRSAVRRLHVASPEGYSTVGSDPASDASLPNRVAALLTKASENLTEPERSWAEIRELVANAVAEQSPTPDQSPEGGPASDRHG